MKCLPSFKTKQEIEKLRNQIEGLYSIIDSSVDITNLAPAKGALRERQRCNAAFLALFHKICELNDLDYFIQYGTLLGSERHGGFIPWDDDIDVCMRRESYNRLEEIVQAKYKSIGMSTNSGAGYSMQVIRLLYKDFPVQIDVFPVDEYDDDSEQGLIDLEARIRECHDRFFKTYSLKRLQRGEISFPRNSFDEMTKEIILGGRDLLSAKVLFTGAEALVYGKPFLFHFDDIYPKQLVDFEGIAVYAPKKPSVCLTAIYGDYLKFPRSKILGHENVAGQEISDSKLILNELQQITEQVNE